jgi:hypothetical protein
LDGGRALRERHYAAARVFSPTVSAPARHERRPFGHALSPRATRARRHRRHAIMREEILGPLLPVEAYSTLDDAIARINARPHPLALYWFGNGPQAAFRRDWRAGARCRSSRRVIRWRLRPGASGRRRWGVACTERHAHRFTGARFLHGGCARRATRLALAAGKVRTSA